MEGTLTDNSAPAAARSEATAFDDARPGTPAGVSGTSLLDQHLDVSTDAELPASMLADLDHPGLVLTDGYVGPERRGSGWLGRLRRATFDQRRSMLRLELVVVAVVVVLAVIAVAVLGSPGRPTAIVDRAARSVVGTQADRRSPSTVPAGSTGHAATPGTPLATAPAVSTTVPSTAPVAAIQPAASAPTPTTAPPAPAPVPPAAAPAAVPTAALTPAQLGAQALTLVRYPWQKIPGYSIQFLSITQAPSSGFYGNTTFTWGRPGGTSVLYVYPGETVARLAGITAFEIGHEVDAAAVQPGGGEAQIENILGIHPASWAPNCDCAEQGFLSGWYAAAFSNYWSPGVGNWSTIAPEPTGAVLTAVEPWLNPTIP